MSVWLAAAALGAAGSWARFHVDAVVERRVDHPLPVGTLAVNVSGSFLLGLLTGFHVSGNGLLLAGSATLGSYTTFSTWMLETERLAEDGALVSAVVNVLLSLVCGLGAAGVGWALGAWA